MYQYTEEQLQQIEKFASIYLKISDMAVILDLPPEQLREDIARKDSEVSKYFSAADLAVLPYRSATQSGISSVSYHFEVPMIVTDVGGLKETIGDRGTGIVASEISPEAISKEILRFFGSEEIRRNCIENIRKEKERLSWKTFAEKLTDFIEQL